MTSHPHSSTRSEADSTDTVGRNANAILLVGLTSDDVAPLATWLVARARAGVAVRALVLRDDGGEVASSRVAALRAEGVETVFARLESGRVGAHTDLVALVRTTLPEGERACVVSPAPTSVELDRRAAARAAISVLASRVAARGTDAAELVWYAADASAGAAGIQRVEVEGVRLVRVPGGALESVVATVDAEVRRALRGSGPALAGATAVVSTWNKRDDVRANLEALHAQTLPFERIVVVDNASRDGTADMVRREFPGVELIVMPHDRFGACETFNVGFKASRSELTAILDDDIVMPPDWLEKATLRIAREPTTTAILSTQVVEPGTPEAYLRSKAVNEERYMSTFRGCASLARSQALREAGYYDERLFIYGNERDLTCRLLNLGYRVLQYPGCGVFHRTPFGIKMGKRSLYYHARNAWISMLKYAPLSDLLRMPWLVVSKVVLRSEAKEAEGAVRDAVGTIGIGRSLRETKGAWWVVTKAGFSVLYNVPYCLKHRRPVKAPDFELPLH